MTERDRIEARWAGITTIAVRITSPMLAAISFTHDGRRIEWWHDRVVEFGVCGQHPRTMTYAGLLAGMEPKR